MARGSKAKYTSKQKRQARDIEKGYEARGVSEPEAARIAWAPVNKTTGAVSSEGDGSAHPPVIAAPAEVAHRSGSP